MQIFGKIEAVLQGLFEIQRHFFISMHCHVFYMFNIQNLVCLYQPYSCDISLEHKGVKRIASVTLSGKPGVALKII